MNTFNKVTMVLIMFLAGITSCSEDDLAPEPFQRSYVTFICGSPSFATNVAPNNYLRLFINEKTSQQDYPLFKISYQFPYPAYNTYLPLTPGMSRLRFADSSAQTVAETTAIFENGKYYTVMVTDSSSRYGTLVLPDAYAAQQEKALLRIIDLCPDGREVDFFVDTVLVKAFSGIPFRGYTPYEAVAPGVNIAVTAKQHDPSARRLARISIPALERGKVYTLLLTGLAWPPENEVVNKGAKLTIYEN